ncbi:MAG: exodeoxyribonuclease VII small subunit [Alphaproteobacteria bacterium]|nr:exodeoxyribonuclease VII small subunit [Alphaproteobacteria bacterium]
MTQHSSLPADHAASSIDVLTFEQAMGRLEQIVTTLDAGNAPLEDAVKLYEEGKLLQARCDKILKDFEARIQIADEASDSPAR